jgi:hypothetical protein
MYLVGARFRDAATANHALGELRDRIPFAPGDLGVRPLGSLRYERPAVGVVVAGRFESADVESVVSIMERHGGEIVFRRTEWRHPRQAASRGERSCARCQRLTGLRT